MQAWQLFSHYGKKMQGEHVYFRTFLGPNPCQAPKKFQNQAVDVKNWSKKIGSGDFRSICMANWRHVHVQHRYANEWWSWECQLDAMLALAVPPQYGNLKNAGRACLFQNLPGPTFLGPAYCSKKIGSGEFGVFVWQIGVYNTDTLMSGGLGNASWMLC